MKKKPKAYSYIRMSTAEQLKGDSLRRQLARTERYAADNGLQIVEQFDDLGMSAYRGRNIEFGNLKRFKELIESGEIERGSYLIVESMDRLSRQHVMKALIHLTDIVNRGIILVTLDDQQIYSEATLQENHYKLIIALGAMARAHEESKRKSGLLIDAWEEKKRKAREDGLVLTSKVPGWLRVDKSSNTVVEIPERSAVVREIFVLTRDGWGAYSVSRHLNERKESPWSKRRNAVWRESYIKKIIANRAVLGEYQPHRLIHDDRLGKTRVPDGESIKGYYPAIVDEVLFRDAALAMSRRRITGRGRKGLRYSNLFSGMLQCTCTARYQYIDKGPLPKGGQYLQCSVAYAKGRCQMKPLRYQKVELALLDVIESLDVERVLGGDARNKRLADKRHDLAMLQMDASHLEVKIQRVINTIMEDDDAPRGRLKIQLNELERDLALSAIAIAELECEIGEMLEIDPLKRKAIIAGLLKQIRATDGSPQNEVTRRALVGELQRMIAHIEVLPMVRIAWEEMADDPDWKTTFKVGSQSELERLFRDHGFAFNIVYRSGDMQHVDGLDGLVMKLRGNPKLERLKFLSRSQSALTGSS